MSEWRVRKQKGDAQLRALHCGFAPALSGLIFRTLTMGRRESSIGDIVQTVRRSAVGKHFLFTISCLVLGFPLGAAPVLTASSVVYSEGGGSAVLGAAFSYTVTGTFFTMYGSGNTGLSDVASVGQELPGPMLLGTMLGPPAAEVRGPTSLWDYWVEYYGNGEIKPSAPIIVPSVSETVIVPATVQGSFEECPTTGGEFHCASYPGPPYFVVADIGIDLPGTLSVSFIVNPSTRTADFTESFTTSSVPEPSYGALVFLVAATAFFYRRRNTG